MRSCWMPTTSATCTLRACVMAGRLQASAARRLRVGHRGRSAGAVAEAADLIAKDVNFINNSASCAGVDTAFGYDALVIRTDIAVGKENMVLLEAQCAAFYNGPDLIEVWTLLPAESAYLYDEQAAADLQSDRADLEAFIASLNFPPYEDAQEE